MSPALAQLVQRGNGLTVNPVMSQVTNTAPTFDPNTQPPGAPTAPPPGLQQPQSTPQPQPMGEPGASTATAPTPQTPFSPAEIKTVLGALTNHLKAAQHYHGV